MSHGVEQPQIDEQNVDEQHVDGSVQSSTFPRNPTHRRDLFERALRVLSVVVIFGIVVAALVGFAGLTTGAADGSAGRLIVRVEYATVSRPGIATPFVIDIRSTDGPLPAEATVEIPRVRGTGKRSLSELTPLDLLITVVLGDFVQQGVTQEGMSMTGAVIVVSTFVGWMLLGDALSRRSKNVERVLDGKFSFIPQQR